MTKWEYITLEGERALRSIPSMQPDLLRLMLGIPKADPKKVKTSNYQIDVSSIEIVAVLNALGSAGWELIELERTNSTDTYIFKRPVE